MKKSIKIITVVVIIVLICAVYFVSHNKKRNSCIKECYWGGATSISDHWQIDYMGVSKMFQTREQCLDYCVLIIK